MPICLLLLCLPFSPSGQQASYDKRGTSMKMVVSQMREQRRDGEGLVSESLVELLTSPVPHILGLLITNAQ